MTDEVEIENAGILDAIMTRIEYLAQNADTTEQQTLIDSALNAEIKAREIPLRMKEVDVAVAKAQAEAPVKVAELQRQIAREENERSAKVAQIQADTQIKTAQIQADAQVKAAVQAAAAVHKWRIHLIWGLTLIVVVTLALIMHH